MIKSDKLAYLQSVLSNGGLNRYPVSVFTFGRTSGITMESARRDFEKPAQTAQAFPSEETLMISAFPLFLLSFSELQVWNRIQAPVRAHSPAILIVSSRPDHGGIIRA